MNATKTKKLVTELAAGDQINPPTHEQKWMWKDGVKRRMTVVSVSEGNVDKNGLWMVVTATYGSPYGDRISTGKFSMRPTKQVQVF